MELLAALLSVLLSLVGSQLPGAAGPGESAVTIQLDPAAETTRLPLPKVYGPADPTRPLVVIDPGHGGHDPGAIASQGSVREKDVTLAVSRAVRDALVQSGRVRVAMTRDDDSFLALRDRYELARRLKADLFISIHADAAPNPGASGATIYTLSEVASDDEAARLALRENKADVIGGVNLGSRNEDVNRILIDLAQRESMNVSAHFAGLLYREASPLIPFRPMYHRFASLLVLKAPDIPSILFEAGYLTHDQDVASLRSPDGQKQVALGMRRAIEAHFARRLIDRGQIANATD